MIHGSDVVMSFCLHETGDKEAFDSVLGGTRLVWPNAVIDVEDPNEFGQREALVYENQEVKELWDKDGATKANGDKMMQIIVSKKNNIGHVTVVCDDIIGKKQRTYLALLCSMKKPDGKAFMFCPIRY